MSYNYQSVQYFKRTFNIDSRVRDPFRYPKSNTFQVSLDGEDIQDVQYIKLLDAQIPKTQYNVNECNNGFSLIDNEVQYDIEIPPCNYNIDDLITTLEDLLNNLGSSNNYNVSLVCGKLKIEATGPFELLFACGPSADCIVNGSNGTRREIIKNKSARTILGFEIKNYISNSSNIINAPNLVNLLGESYLLLEIETNQRFSDLITPGSSSTNDAFFKIPLNVSNDNVAFFKNDYQIFKAFSPSIKDLKFLNIKFKTFYGHLYDFQGHNPSFTIEIGTLR